MRSKILAPFALVALAFVGSALAQSYPSQPVFYKTSVGLYGPNSTQLETIYGGDLPRGSLSIISDPMQTDGILNFFQFGADSGTDLYSQYTLMDASNCGYFSIANFIGQSFELHGTPDGGQNCDDEHGYDVVWRLGGSDFGTLDFVNVDLQARDENGGLTMRSWLMGEDQYMWFVADYNANSAAESRFSFQDGDGLIDAPTGTLRIQGGATGEGTPGIQFGAAEIDFDDASLIDAADDNLSIGNDLSVVGDVNITGNVTAANLATVYGGCVDAAATAENVPTGWSASNGSAGNYTVTAPPITAADFAVTVTQQNQVDSGHFIYATTGTGSFAVAIRDVDNVAENEAFCFTVIGIVN